MMGRGECACLERVDRLEGKEIETEMSAGEKVGVCGSRRNPADVDRMQCNRYTQNCSPDFVSLVTDVQSNDL